MAKKMVFAAALLMALIALARATTYTTIVTTAVDEESNPGQQQQCQRQLQGRQFRSCQRYLSQRSGQYGGDEEEEVLEMSTGQQGQQPQQQHLQQCCQELRNVNEQCRCEAVRHAVRQQQQQQEEGGSWQGEQSQQVYQRARSLPRQCNLRPQQCQIRAIFV